MEIYYVVAFCALCILVVGFLAWGAFNQLNDERVERQIERDNWQKERAKLLDRIQSGSFIEYKAQERAETPIKRKEKTEIEQRLERESFL